MAHGDWPGASPQHIRLLQCRPRLDMIGLSRLITPIDEAGPCSIDAKTSRVEERGKTLDCEGCSVALSWSPKTGQVAKRDSRP